MNRNIFILSLLALSVSDCGFRGFDEAGLYGEDASLATAPATFESLKEKVLTPSCIGCHAAFSTEAGLAHYLSAGSPGTSAIYLRTSSGSMPPSGKMSNGKIDLIRRYILALSGQSATQREPGPEPTTPPIDPGTTPSYAQLRDQIFDPMCSRCHGPGGFAGPVFFDEATTRAVARKILEQVETRAMPPPRIRDPRFRPNDQQIEAVRAWVRSLP